MGDEGSGKRALGAAGLIVALLLGGGAVWSLLEPGGGSVPGVGPSGPQLAADGPAHPSTQALPDALAPRPGADPLGPRQIALAPEALAGGGPAGAPPLADGPLATAPLPAGQGARLVGRVVDRGGRPVAGAAVELRGVRRDAPMAITMVKDGPGGPRLIRQGERTFGPETSDQDGRYAFEGVPPEVRWDLSATPPAAAGLLPSTVPAPDLQAGQTTTAPDLALARPASVEGVVLGPDGAPAPGARVALGQLDGPMAALALDAGEEEPAPPPPPGPGGKRVVRRAEKAMAFSVGGPAGRMELGGQAPLEARADAQGRFRFEAVPPGKQALSASRKGDRPARLELELEEGQARQGVELKLQAGLVLALRVTDPSGRPVAEARVEVLGRGPGKGLLTDAEGKAELVGIGQDEVALMVQARGYVPLHSSVRVPEGGTPVELVLRRGATLVGTVVKKTDRTPVARGFVMAQPLVHDGRLSLVMGSDDGRIKEGRFSLSGVAPGRYQLRVSSPKLAEAVTEVEVPPGTEVLDVGQVLLGELGTIAVTVLDPDGAPVEGAEVQLGLRMMGGGGGAVMVMAVHTSDEDEAGDDAGEEEPEGPSFRGMGQSARTDAAGKARLPAVQPGKATVQAVKDGWAPAWSGELEVPEDGGTVEATLKLARGGRVVGRVRGTGGSPLAGAQVLLLRRGNPLPAGQAQSDAEGRYAFERVAPGSYRLTLAARSGPEATPAWFEVEDEATLTRDLDAEQRAALEGTVRDAAGSPLGGVKVEIGLLLPGGFPGGGTRIGFASASAESDASGRFRVDGLSPGTAGRELGITLTPPGGEPETWRLALESATGTTRREWRLGAADGEPGVVTARALDAEGRPVAGEPVGLESLDPERPLVQREVVTDAEGVARFEGLPAGRWSLSAGAAPLARARVEVALPAGGAAEAPPLRLVQGGTLAVELPAGGYGQATVQVETQGEPPRMSFAAAGETVRVGGLTPGRDYAVSVRAEGQAAFQATIRAQAGEVPLRATLTPAPQ